MTYRATNESSTQSGEERSQEARRILAMGLEDMASREDLQSKKEIDFVAQMSSMLDTGVEPSVKQLWWLRDLKDKYL